MSHSPVLTLQEIASNTIAKEKILSYLSRPIASELTKASNILTNIPEDLLADVTFTQPKNISLAHIDLHRYITNLVECSDATKIAMSSTCGVLIGLDVVSQEIYKKMLSFDSSHEIDVNNESIDESTDIEELLGGTPIHSDSMNDYVFSSDSEVNADDWIDDNYDFNNLEIIDHKYFADNTKNYIEIALSPDGKRWGVISPVHNDRLLIGNVNDLFDPEVGDCAQIYNQISMAEELGTNFGTLKELTFKSSGLQSAAVWETISTLFNDTQKLIFCQEDGSIKETREMPRVHMVTGAHNAPLLAASHENGIVSFWDTQRATLLSEIKIFDPEELVSNMRFSHDDTTIYAASVMGKLCAFNKDSKQKNQRYVGDIEIIESHPQDLCVATAIYNGDEGKVILWSKDLTKKLAEFAYHATALNFSHDGTFLYVVTQDKQFHRIPLGNPWELVCLRAWHSCRHEQDQCEAFKSWDIYKKVMSQEGKKRGLLAEPLRDYFTLMANQ